MTADKSPFSESPNLEGRIFRPADESERREAVDVAFDYRGDVTLELRTGEKVEGYIFNRDATASPPMIAEGGPSPVAFDRATGTPAAPAPTIAEGGPSPVAFDGATGTRAARAPTLHMYIHGQTDPRVIPYTDIVAVAFSGEDTASGKSWEVWVKKKESERLAESAQVAAEARSRGHL